MLIVTFRAVPAIVLAFMEMLLSFKLQMVIWCLTLLHLKANVSVEAVMMINILHQFLAIFCYITLLILQLKQLLLILSEMTNNFYCSSEHIETPRVQSFKASEEKNNARNSFFAMKKYFLTY